MLSAFAQTFTTRFKSVERIFVSFGADSLCSAHATTARAMPTPHPFDGSRRSESTVEETSSTSLSPPTERGPTSSVRRLAAPRTLRRCESSSSPLFELRRSELMVLKRATRTLDDSRFESSRRTERHRSTALERRMRTFVGAGKGGGTREGRSMA